MTDLTEERAIMLIVHGGNARSHALKAIDLASTGNIKEANKLMEEATRALRNAGRIQKQYIEENLSQATEEKFSMNIMEIHAQDHYMNALTVIDLAEKFIALYNLEKKASV